VSTPGHRALVLNTLRRAIRFQTILSRSRPPTRLGGAHASVSNLNELQICVGESRFPRSEASGNPRFRAEIALRGDTRPIRVKLAKSTFRERRVTGVIGRITEHPDGPSTGIDSPVGGDPAFGGYVRSLKKDSGGHTEIGGPRSDSACRWPLHCGPAAEHVEPHGIGDGNPDATLINDGWCELFRQYSVRIGVTIDGPAFLHDKHRKTRRGSGTHSSVMKGVECLKNHDIDFHAIAVVTADALHHPREMFQFFLDSDITNVGFNIEEQEGAHQLSTLGGTDKDTLVRAFFAAIYDLQKCTPQVKIREFNRAFRSLAAAEDGGASAVESAVRGNHQMLPFGIVSVDYEGNACTFPVANSMRCNSP
jgi:hypothetical protein